MQEARRLVDSIYKRHCAGCCWHVVLDDGNIEDNVVAWVANEWLEQTACKRPECRTLAPLMIKMTKTQRKKLGRGGYKS